MLFDVFLHAIKEHECIRGWVGKPEIAFKYSDSCLFRNTDGIRMEYEIEFTENFMCFLINMNKINGLSHYTEIKP